MSSDIIEKEKVGFKEKLLTNIGKRRMFRKQRNIGKLVINLAYREIIKLILDIEGNLESALEKLFEISTKYGHNFLQEWIYQGSVILSKYVGDHAVWIKAGYYSFTGDNIKDIKFIPATNENENPKIIWTIDDCFLCAGMDRDDQLKLNKETLGKMGYCVAIAGIFQTTVNLINEYTGIKYKGVVRETKCKLKGDPYDEFIVEFYPTD